MATRIPDNAARFRGLPSVVIWHNRLKFVNRIRVLYEYHVAQGGQHHCSARVTWRSIRNHCCGRANLLGTSSEGRYQPIGGPAQSHAWPVWYADVNLTRDCGERPAKPALDLTKTARWHGLGIQLEPNTSLTEQA